MEDIIILIVFGFLAAFIDSIAGGGGIISVPALLLTGLPPSLALGTNKLASTMASSLSSLTYLKSHHVNRSVIKKLIPFTAIGAFLGVVMLRIIPSEQLKPVIVLLLIAVTVYTLIKPSPQEKEGIAFVKTKKSSFLFMLMALILGFYDGFFGPGTGSLLIFGFSLANFSFLQAAANGKILNFTSNFVSLISFFFFGLIDFHYGLIMGLAMLPGAYLGSKMAIHKGSKLVKPCFVIVTLFLIGKEILTYLHII